MLNIDRFKDLIKKSKTILITTHISPDADGIGSQIALSHALKALGKTVYCINEESLESRYHYLDKAKIVQGYSTPFVNKLKKLDLFIVVDANSLERVGENLKHMSQSSKELLFIDHHPTQDEFIALHCIDTASAATGEIITKLIDSLGVKFTYEMALAIYTSIIIDTCSFQYPTVSPATHKIVSKLLKAGVSPPYAAKEIYGQKNVMFYHFLGKVLSRTKTNESKKVIYVQISLKDLDQFSVDAEDTHGIINQLLSFKPAEVVCMFREIDKDCTKVSLRSMGKVNVGSIASALGGGGHSYSAATVIKLSLKKTIKHVLDKIDLILNRTGA